MRLADRRLSELLDAFSSSDPTPGGGSASALAAAVGAALLAMVAALPKTRTANSDEERQTLDGVRRAIVAVRDRLGELVDLDSQAYDAVAAAYRLPRTSDAERSARRDAVQAALVRATEVPIDVMRSTVAAIGHAAEVARHGNPSAASDVGVALELLGAGLRGAALNVRINLQGLSDRAQAAQLDAERTGLESRGAEGIARARALLGQE